MHFYLLSSLQNNKQINKCNSKEDDGCTAWDPRRETVLYVAFRVLQTAFGSFGCRE